ncbi:MAG: hypothetical protein JXO22_05825 [Phycisphaerae bacterium]|nr:hypothetical protein [Phycisphaerae bacterium]
MSDFGAQKRKLILLCVVGILAVVAILRYTALAPEDTTSIRPTTRTAFNFLSDWTCTDPTCGGQETKVAATGPDTCPKCGKQTLWPSFRFAGSDGKEYRVWFNYDEKGKQREVKIGNEPWKPARDENGRTTILDPATGDPLIAAEQPRHAMSPEEEATMREYEAESQP